MKRLLQWVSVAGLWLVWIGSTGCSTPNVNPPAPRAHTGYVDFYTDSDLGLSWEVKLADKRTGKLRTVFSEFKPVEGSILRLAAAPGKHRFQVWFINQFTEGPQTAQVQVEDGKVTPVHVTLTPASPTFVRQKNYAFRGSAKGYGRGTKITTEEGEVFHIGLDARVPEAYQPKEQKPYWSLTTE